MSNRNQTSLKNFKPVINSNHNIYKVVLHASSAQVVSISFNICSEKTEVADSKTAESE